MHTPAAIVFTASFAIAQTTWVVDDNPGPGVHFTSLPAAVAAAASGDTLLVAPGSYQPFQVTGKALTILGSGIANTFVENAPVATNGNYVAIELPPPGSTFRIAGLRIRRDLGPDLSANRLAVTGTATSGAVVLSDVVSEPATSTATSAGIGLAVWNGHVHAYRCEFNGGWCLTTFGDFGSMGAYVASASRFVADASTIRGGSPPNSSQYNTVGGRGLDVRDSQCHLSRSSVRGGNAGSAQTSAMGGPGLAVQGNSQVHLYGSAADVIVGGNAGPFVGPSGFSWGNAGINCAAPAAVSVHGPVTISGGTGTTTTAPPTSGAVRTGLAARCRLTITGILAPSGDLLATQPVTIAVDNGSPGQLFVLLIDLSPGFTTLPGLSTEPLLVSPACLIAAFGLLDAAGHFAMTLVPSAQAPAWVNLPLHWQAFEWSPPQGLWLGSNAEQRRFGL